MYLKHLNGCFLLLILCAFILPSNCDISETVYTVSLAPNQVVGQEVLPDNQNSYGTGFCRLNRYRTPPTLTCSVQHNVGEVLNVSVNVGHRGVVGPSLYYFPVQGQYLQTTWELSDLDNLYNLYNYTSAEQMEDFLNGLWYIEIISLDFPIGEIRGQIEHKDRFYSYLTPQNTIPRSSGSQAHGVAVGTIVPGNSRELTFSILHDVTLATSIDLGVGNQGSAGSIAASVSPANSPSFPIITLTYSEAIYAYQDLLFLSVASQSNLHGDIRGQLVTIDYVNNPTHIARLNGNQAQSNSNAVGSAIFSLDCKSNVLEFLIIHTLENAESAYINAGAIGSVDSVLYPLITGTSPIFGRVTLNSDELGLLTNNLLFVGIYTEESGSSGTIRGQITNADWKYFAYLSGTNVVPPVSTSSVGLLLLNPQRGDSEYTLEYELLHTIENAFSAALYYGGMYENGKKLLELPSAQSPTKFKMQLTKDEYTLITSQSAYLLIETSDHLFGVVRGQTRPLSTCTINNGVSDPSDPVTNSLKSSEEEFLRSGGDIIVVYLNSSSSLLPSIFMFFMILLLTTV